MKNEDLYLKIVSDIVKGVDYDIWKGLFVEDCFEQDPEDIEYELKALCKIVEKHVKNIKP